MELLSRQAVVALQNPAAAACSGLLLSTSSLCCAVDAPGVAVRGSSSSSSSSSSSRSKCRRLKVVSRMILLSRGLGRGLERRTVCRSGSVDYSFPRFPDRWMAPISGRSYSRAERREQFNSTSRHIAADGEIGQCKEGVVRVGRLFVKGRCHRMPVAMAGLNNSNNGESNVDLELEIFRFMQQSSKPDAFPTKQDLVSAGRTDLVRAIGAEAGWLAAGWGEEEEEEEEEDEDEETANNSPTNESMAAAQKERGTSPRRSKKKWNASKSRGATTLRSDKSEYDNIDPVNGNDVVWGFGDTLNGKDRRVNGNQMTTLDTDPKGWEELQIPEQAQQDQFTQHGWKSSSRRREDDLQVVHEVASLFSFTAEELKLNRPQRGGQQWGSLSQASPRNEVAKRVNKATPSINISRGNGSEIDTLVEALLDKYSSERGDTGVQDSKDGISSVAVIPKKKIRKKKEREKAVEPKKTNGEVIGRLDWTEGQMGDESAQPPMLEPRSKASSERLFGPASVVDSSSMQTRIRTLEAKLVDTRAALQSGREALRQTGSDQKEPHREAIAKLIDAEDALEFRESAIMHARSELNTTRAQVTALEGTLMLEIMEARKALEEKNQNLDKARNALNSLRTARIVWPNPAKEVFVMGSFDGWNKQIKTEKSSAGVFVVSLPLYPGRYEMKFVVDGLWKVDTNRPIVYKGGYENNVLVVS